MAAHDPVARIMGLADELIRLQKRDLRISETYRSTSGWYDVNKEPRLAARTALETAIRAELGEVTRLRAAIQRVPEPTWLQARDPEALLYLNATVAAEIRAALAPPPDGGD